MGRCWIERLVRAGGLLMVWALAAYGQEYRATLLGLVMDSSGAVVPEAAVTATNTGTGVKASTKASGEGNYVIPYLMPGTYHLRVEHAGFRTFEQSPVELQVNSRVRVDVKLQPGLVSERVEVHAEAPLLETATADRGQVVGSRLVTELPTQSRNPYTLMNLSTGVNYTGSLLYYRPFDNGAINSFSINGGVNSSNEFQMDGVPNNSAGTMDVAYVPPVEATQEFKIQTNTYDAQYGRTGGGVINVTTKAGTNDPHGTGYWYFRRTPFYANTYLLNSEGESRIDQRVDQYGFEVEGPVFLPKVYNGKDRTFFMFSLEKYKDVSPLFGATTALSSVPTDAQRTGDFSSTYNSGGQLMSVYDPLTTRLNPNYDSSQPVTASNLQYIRTPFAGNAIPSSRLNAVALNMLKSVPAANQAGDEYTSANNYLASGTTEINTFYNAIARVDHNINDRWRVSGRWDRSFRKILNPLGQEGWNTPASTGDFWAARINNGAAADLVATLSPTTILNLRVGLTRYNTFAKFTNSFDQSSLGFPSSYLSQLPLPDRFPDLAWENYTGTANPGDNLATPSNTYSLGGTLTKILGQHSLKMGAEYRIMQYGYNPTNNGNGYFSFTRSFTEAGPQIDDSVSGNAIASFLLGYMDSASATINTAPYYSWHFPVLFVQDEWLVTPQLSLSLGLRWDYESPVVERYNRQLRGFDFNVASPVSVAGYNLKGGLLYANPGARGAFNSDWNNIQPRIGMAYRPFKNKPVVFRAGYGVYYLPTTDTGLTTGYSLTTNAATTTSEFQPATTLSNPFPNGLTAPAGSSLGLSSQLGDTAEFNNLNRSIPRLQTWSAGFETELRKGLLLEATYVGSRTTGLQVSRNLNYLTADQLALGTERLNTEVANPFYGVLPVTTTRGAQSTVQLRDLLLPYPQYSSVVMDADSLGRSWYNAVQLRLEQRFRSGLTFLVSYTNSKSMQATDFKNAQDALPSRELSGNDIPQRLVISGVYALPMGHGRRWMNNGLASQVLGGWQMSWSGGTQSGRTISLPGDYYITGDIALSEGQTRLHWFNTSSGLWVSRPADTLRTSQLNSTHLRTDWAPTFDVTLMKEFHIKGDRHRAEYRVSAFNVTNTAFFRAPDMDPTSSTFGQCSANQRNMPRSVEMALRYRF